MSLSERKFDLLIGAPGSGKSSFTVPVIKSYRQNLIIVKHLSNVDDNTHSFLTHKNQDNWRQGASPSEFVKCKFAFRDKEEYLPFLKWVSRNYRNGYLIIDDASIFERDRLSPQMIDLVAMRRHYGIDLMLIYHGFTQCPIDQFIYANNLLIFNTNDNPNYKKNKIPQFDRVEVARSQAKRNFQSTDTKVKYRPVRVDITSM